MTTPVGHLHEYMFYDELCHFWVPIDELPLCEEHNAEESIPGPRAADVISHCAWLIASIQITGLVEFN